MRTRAAYDSRHHLRDWCLGEGDERRDGRSAGAVFGALPGRDEHSEPRLDDIDGVPDVRRVHDGTPRVQPHGSHLAIDLPVELDGRVARDHQLLTGGMPFPCLPGRRYFRHHDEPAKPSVRSEAGGVASEKLGRPLEVGHGGRPRIDRQVDEGGPNVEGSVTSISHSRTLQHIA